MNEFHYGQMARQRHEDDMRAATRYRMAAEMRRRHAAERWERRASRFQAMSRWAMRRSAATARPARLHVVAQ
jgi:hypothetical protein